MRTLTISILFLTLAVTANGQTKNDMREFDPNFAHTVYFWFKDPESKEARATFEKSLQKFLDNSKYAKTSFIGAPPKASRDVVDGSFTYSLIVTFESAEAQKNYQDEAPHKVFIEESSALWEKVIVYDSKGIQ
ncbi:Dabb family protein [Zobellia uliginosa]|uniref:Dabb family protein n=1 Tax=Zobellia uliginosa TaxID=143224 RepID=UPI001C0659A3|nr:Dabb family protein [Zobellia uliginosa]MBU2947728.1 Dabb family protein [Zobellia uliginosa]